MFEFTIYVFAAIGLVVAMIAAGLAMIFGYWFIDDKWSERCGPKRTAAHDEEAERLANRMLTDADWFSESEPTWRALKLYAEGMKTNRDIGSVRSQWQDECATVRSA